jgi:uncharacterized protein (TIGR00251 family)
VGICLAGADSLSVLPFLRRSADGVTVDLRVQPRARRTALEISAGALKASVTAPPEDGRANDAVIVLLADTWRLPKSTFAVIKGMTVRDKTLRVSGDPALLAARIGEWMKTHG